METCILIPKVKNKENNYVESKLFKDLLDFTENDRELTKILYAIGTDERIIDKIGDKASFDENNELTIESLLNYTKLKVDDEKILRTLNRKLGEGDYPFDLGISKVTTFNRNNPKGKYIATFKESQEGNIYISIVKRSDKNIKALELEISSMTLKKRLEYRLNTLGFDVKYLQDNNVNIFDVFRNINHLIELKDNENLTELLADTVSRTVVGLMANSPLYTRLLNSITLDVAKSILGDRYNIVENPFNEASITLISQFLLNGEDTKLPSKNLISRIIQYVKNKLSKFGKSRFEKDMLEAEQNAKDIISDFTSQEFAEYVKQKMKDKEVLYLKDSINVSTFKSIIRLLNKQAAQIEAVDKKLADKYKLLSETVSSGKLFDTQNIFTNIVTIQGIKEALYMIVDTLPEMVVKLQSVDLYNLENDDPDVLNMRIKYAKTLREVSIFLLTSLLFEDIINKATTKEETSVRLSGVEEKDMNILRQLNKTLSETNRMLSGGLLTKLKEFSNNVLEENLGRKFVVSANKILFNFKDFNLGHLKTSIRHIVVKDAEKEISISDLLTNLAEDIWPYERYLNSMSNSGDLVHLSIDKMRSLSVKKANDKINEVWDYLVKLQGDLKKLGHSDTSMFFETSARTGKLTGNIISEYVWGDWEDDYNDFRKEKRKEFLDNHDLRGKSETEKDMLFADYFNPERKMWHKLHSTYNNEDNMYYPNNTYKNDKYFKTIKDKPEEEWLKEYMSLLSYVKDALPPGSMRYFRAPLIKGRVIHLIKNAALSGNKFKGGVLAIARNIRDTFVESSEDTDFGSDATYNKREDDMFGNDILFEKEKINRLPLFGINKLSNMNDLSTDLFHSTLSFASMAFTYESMENTVHSLEVMNDALKNRKIEGDIEDLKHPSKSYARLQTFLEMLIYNVGHKRRKYDKHMVAAKTSRFLTSMGGKVLLGGNVTGGIANLQQGLVEIFKEAASGEFFNLRNFKNANKNYFNNLPLNLLEAGEDLKLNKVSLIIRKMNIGYENDTRYREFHTSKSRLYKLNPFGENLFLPYKTGEHYMQTIGFLALMDAVKVVDSNNKEISLWDAYEVTPFDPTNPKSKKTLLLKEGIKYFDPITKQLREWTLKDEAELMNKSREINNRLHGIYNKGDKTAFQLTIFGAMLLSMRGYALGMINRRFGRSKYNISLGKDVEGTIITLSKVLASTFTDVGGFDLTLRALLLPFSKDTVILMDRAGFSSNQIANMKRNMGDAFFMALSSFLKALFARPKEGWDDDDEDMFYGILYYFASRLNTEQSALNSPWGAIKEIPVLSNINPVGFSVLLQLVDIGKLAITGEEYVSTGEKKWVNKAERLIPYYRSWLLMLDPYKAAKSYQYGRTTITR